jgi:signal transduction histidine kinase
MNTPSHGGRGGAPAAEADGGRELRETLHDIRNHLNAVLGLVSMILLQSRDESVVRYRPLVEEQSEQLRHLIVQLDDRKGRAADGQGASPPVDAPRFVPALVDLYAPYAAEYGMRLKFRVEPGMQRLPVDGRALHRLLSNLLVNAIKHSQASLVVLRAAPLDPTRPQAGVRFTVVDDGVGIEAPVRQVIGRVLAGEQAVTGEYDRSGLGIVARLARQLGASVEIDSAPEDGTTVTVAVPALRVEPLQRAA